MRVVLAQHMALPANRERFAAMTPQLPPPFQSPDGTTNFDSYLDWIRTPRNWG